MKFNTAGAANRVLLVVVLLMLLVEASTTSSTPCFTCTRSTILLHNALKKTNMLLE
jgi:hypothetical protein